MNNPQVKTFLFDFNFFPDCALKLDVKMQA